MELFTFTKQLSNRSKVIIGLFLFYILLQVEGFTWSLGHEFLYLFLKFLVGLVIFILLINTNLPGLHRFLLIIGYFTLLFGISKLDLWTFSANTYIRSNQSVFDQVIALLDTKKSPNISVSKKTVTESKGLPLSVAEKKVLLTLFDDTDVIEIDVQNGNVLFTFFRFIDNGYGLLYLTNPGPSNGSRFQVPYDITAKVSLNQNWYYVSFT